MVFDQLAVVPTKNVADKKAATSMAQICTGMKQKVMRGCLSLLEMYLETPLIITRRYQNSRGVWFPVKLYASCATVLRAAPTVLR